jgi:NADH-quinone oxidoreductase subunit G
MLILGQGTLARADGGRVLSAARRIADTCGLVKEGWNGFNVLHGAAARVGGLDLGFVPGPGGRNVAGILAGAAAGEIDIVYLLAADECDTGKLAKSFVIYQGHHGDAGAHVAQVVLPGAAYTEKDATYVNTEGRPQRAHRAGFPPGRAREDWRIVRALSERLGRPLPYNTIDQLRDRMVKANPIFGKIGIVEAAPWSSFGDEGAMDPAPFQYPIANFYMTDPISRASETMAKCTQVYVARSAGKTGTHG